MYRAFVVLAVAYALAGCSHDNAASQPAVQAAPPAGTAEGGCAEADWQAQTAAVINKRQGQEALDNYDTENGEEGHKPCP
ncbi:hypothetical protein [Pseudomonas sp. RIT-PI-S]|uniref:hypothetical protein n=1 Tax=Pseudomonas sp. RIT-PI-S TaxID=3035295 RepID=UPI0021DADCBF|nr:hypothetical protein [Pseudomonas sp. RIT-PI-S]